MKYKVTLDIHGEPLIRLLARYAPFDITGVEELPPEPVSSPLHADRVITGLRSQVKLAKPKPQRAKRNRGGPNLKEGINKLIMDILEDGPQSAIAMRGVMEATGYSPNSIGSRLQALEEHGIVKRTGNGKWKLLERTSPPAAMSEVGGR